MKALVSILLFLSLSASYAAPPAGWVEMPGPDPILLTWAKVVPGKKLEASPTVMIQKHETSSRWKSILKKIPAEKDGCKKVAAKDSQDWHQRYCEKDKNIYVYLWRGDEEDTEPALEMAKEWLKKNE